MIISKRYRFAIGLILAVSCLPLLSAEPNKPPLKLTYVVSASTIRISRFKKDAPILPTYVARFTVRWYFAPPDDPNTADLLDTPAGMTLSDLQQKFMRDNQTDWLWSRDHEGIYNYEIMGFVDLEVQQGHKSYDAYAVSKEDASKMATALVEFLSERGTDKAQHSMQQHVEKLSKRQRQLKTTLTQAKQEADAKDSELKSANQEYERAVRRSYYSLQRMSDVPNELRKGILEMNTMLDILHIEIAGIKSKISVIRKYSVPNVKGQDTLRVALREMAIREEIELAGAESRRQAIMGVKKNKRALYDLYKKSLALAGEAGELASTIKRDENNMKMIEKELARWDSGEPLFLVENKNTVSIRPLRIE